MTPHLLAGPAAAGTCPFTTAGFFRALPAHHTWMKIREDSEWVATAKLGRAWKDLSKKSDAELGIDPNTRVQ